MENSISICPHSESNCLTIYFLDKNGEAVQKAQFWNWVGNGDTLACVASDWINSGLLPIREEKGLIFF